MTNTASVRHAHRISILQAAATGAAAFGALFAACWVGAQIPSFGATHAYIALFTPAAVRSPEALAQGVGWSVVFGGFASASVAFFYNLFAFVGRHGR